MVSPIKSPRVLSVDDDEDTREMLGILLNSVGVELTSVSTASEVLVLSQTGCFDAYLLDAWLPDLDGVELCRRLRNLDPHAVVVFYSGAAYEADRKRAMEAGASAYVCKPDVDGLIEKIWEFATETGRNAVVTPRRRTSPLQLVNCLRSYPYSDVDEANDEKLRKVVFEPSAERLTTWAPRRFLKIKTEGRIGNFEN